MEIPEPLVTIRWYSAPEFAAVDREALLEGGIPAYLGGRYSRYREAVELRVPESQVEQALDILGEPRPENDPLKGAVGEDQRPIRCPLCLSAAVIPQPPYGLGVMLVGGAAAAYAFAIRWFAAAAVAIVVTIVVSARIDQKVPKWRCPRCHHAWREQPNPYDR